MRKCEHVRTWFWLVSLGVMRGLGRKMMVVAVHVDSYAQMHLGKKTCVLVAPKWLTNKQSRCIFAACRACSKCFFFCRCIMSRPNSFLNHKPITPQHPNDFPLACWHAGRSILVPLKSVCMQLGTLQARRFLHLALAQLSLHVDQFVVICLQPLCVCVVGLCLKRVDLNGFLFKMI